MAKSRQCKTVSGRNKVRHATEAEARTASQRANRIRLGSDGVAKVPVPYQCGDCGFWHIGNPSTKRRT